MLSGLAVLAWLGGAAAESREFTLLDAKGRSIEVDVQKVTPSQVEFRKGGRPMKLDLSKLDPENEKALLAFAKKHRLFQRFPPLKYQVAVRDRAPRQEDSSYMRTLLLTPQITLESEESLKPIPELLATIKVICFETEAYYAEKRREYRIKAVDTKKVPAARDGSRRSFDFKTFKLEFDEDRDTSNTGGWKYRFWICYLTDPESGEVIQWKTSYDALERHLEKYPEETDKYLGLKMNAEVPTKFSIPVPKGVFPGKN